jgi:hypothetical protein
MYIIEHTYECQVGEPGWGTAAGTDDHRADSETFPGFAPGTVDVPFVASTTGSPDGSIARQANWVWGFTFARRSATSRWLLVSGGSG